MIIPPHEIIQPKPSKLQENQCVLSRNSHVHLRNVSLTILRIQTIYTLVERAQNQNFFNGEGRKYTYKAQFIFKYVTETKKMNRNKKNNNIYF